VVDEAKRAAAQLDTPDHNALDRQLGRELATQAEHLGAAASGCAEGVHMHACARAVGPSSAAL